MNKRHHGSTLDSLLKEEVVFEEAQTRAIRECLVRQVTAAKAKQSLSNAPRRPRKPKYPT